MLTKKRIVSIIISFLMVFAMMPLMAGKAHAADYNLYVCGVQITSENAENIPGLSTGTASYNPNTSTLTLNDATITHTNPIEASIYDFKIVLMGKNEVSGSNYGIKASWGVTITGTGSLKVEGSMSGIATAIDAVTIDGTTVNATGNNSGGISSAGDLTITNSTVTATSEGVGSYGIKSSGKVKIEGNSDVHAAGGFTAISGGSGITIGNGLAITEPVNWYIDGGVIMDSDLGDYATKATIGPQAKYPLWVGGTQVTSVNAGDIPAKYPATNTGKASYDAETNTLTLDNYVCENCSTSGTVEDVGAIDYEGRDELKIILKGNNKVKGISAGSDSNGINADYGSLLIYGEGSLSASGTGGGWYSAGINCNLDIKIEGGKITAQGESSQRSYGIISEVRNVTISGGTVEATAGNSDLVSYGIMGTNEVTIDGGSVTATAGTAGYSYGICVYTGAGLVTIGEGVTRVEATGHTRAIGNEVIGSVSAKNAIPGTGWSNVEGTEGETAIPIHKETVAVDFKKVIFDTTKPEPTPTPSEVSGTLLAKMTAKGKRSLVLSWNKINGAEGYDVFFVKCNHNNPCEFVKTIKGNQTFKWTKKKLKKKTAYKAYVKAWVMKDGKKSYVKTSPTIHVYTSGSTKNYTNAKSVTVKKTAVSLSKGNTYQIKAKVKKLKKGKKLMKKGHGPKLRYLSSDTNIAEVSSSGVITAKAKGKCKVYVYAVNGVYKTVKVTVK